MYKTDFNWIVAEFLPAVIQKGFAVFIVGVLIMKMESLGVNFVSVDLVVDLLFRLKFNLVGVVAVGKGDLLLGFAVFELG